MKTRNKTGLMKRTAMIMSALLLFASLVTGVFVFLNGNADTAEAYDGSGKVTLTYADTSTVGAGNSTINTLNRHGKSWWKFSVSGISNQTIFCLNSSRSMHTGDTVSYTIYSATDFADSVSANLAKAMTYYNGTLSGGAMSGLTASQTKYAVQVYCWAASMSKTNIIAAVTEGLQNTGMAYSAANSYATTLYNNIYNTSPYGTIYYYTTTKCKNGGSSVQSTHQHLLGWVNTEPNPVEYGFTSKTLSVSTTVTYTIPVTKTDSDTGNAMDASFYIYFDGTNVKDVASSTPTASPGSYNSSTGVFTTSSGSLSAKVKITLTGNDVESATYTYVKNWNSLSKSQQAAETAKGYYDSKETADAVALADAKARQTAAKEALASQSHTWKVEEIEAEHHTTAASQSKKTTSTSVGTFSFVDTPIWVRVTITKTAEAGHAVGTNATLKNATYGIYANETIYDTDNSTPLYSKGDLICTITTDKNGKATSGYVLLEGYKYYAQETKAPTGYNKNTTKYYFTTDLDELDSSCYTKDNTAGTKYTININKQQDEELVTDTPISSPVVIYKAYEALNQSGEIYTLPEEAASFTLTEKVSSGTGKSYTFEYVGDIELYADGNYYAMYQVAEVPYGTYVISQTAWTDGTIPMADKTITIKEGDGPTYTPLSYTYIDKIEAASVTVSKVTSSLNEIGVEVTEEEEGAEFVVLRSAAEADGEYVIFGFKVAEDGTISIDETRLMDPAALNDLTAEQRQQYVQRLKAYAKSSLGGLEVAFAYVTVTAANGSTSTSLAEITTDANGEAFSYIESTNSDQYFIVLQTAGAEGYQLANVSTSLMFKISANSVDNAQVSTENDEDQDYFAITKYTCYVDGTEVAVEADAVFTLLDAQYVTAANIKLALEAESYDYSEVLADAGSETAAALLAVMDEDQRQALVDYLGEAAYITAITTDENGFAWTYLVNHYTEGFVVLQTDGTDGYALMPALWQTDAVSQDTVDAMSAEDLAKAQEAGLMIYATNTIEGDDCDRVITEYTVEYTDVFDGYGYIEITKTAETGNGTWEVEEGAQFILYDADGNRVTYHDGSELVLVTDADGYVTTEGTGLYLPYGRYTIEQIYSPNNHALMSNTKFYLTKEYRHESLSLSYANNSKPIELVVTKYSDDTYGLASATTPVADATYTVYAVEDIVESTTVKKSSWSSEDQSNGITVYYSTLYSALDEVASFTTDENGRGSVSLPYGTFYLKESESPLTYVTNEERIYFTLKEEEVNGEYVPVILVYDTSAFADDYVVTMDDLTGCTYTTTVLGTADAVLEAEVRSTFEIEDDTYAGTLDVYDTPVYGEISVYKTGQAAVESEDGAAAFEYTYTYEPLAGCVFALYAAEDIYTDGGVLVWAEGTQISTVTTDENGEGTFTWTKDGVETADLYLGSYYVVETYAPYGYTFDDTAYNVVLTYDHTAELMNTLRTDTDGSETGSAVGNSGLEASTGQYVLITGEELNPYLTDAVHVIFTWKAVTDGYTAVDVSSNQDDSVKLWVEDDTVYISTCTDGQAVIFNVDSSCMFKDCKALTTISFNNVDTSECVYMSSMFENCISLTVLDLSMFDTNKVQFVDSMFENCGGLKTIYVSSDTTVFNYDDATITYIDASANHRFISNYSYDDGEETIVVEGDTFTASDFTFTGWYTADYYPTPFPGYLTVTEDDVASFSPAKASTDYAVEYFKLKDTDEDGAYYTMWVTITLTEEYVSALEKETGAEEGTINRTIDVLVTVCDPTKVAVTTQYDDHPTVTVEAQDELISLEVQLWKIDEDSVGADDDDKEYLAGAQYTVYANCTIGYYDESGAFVTLYEAGDKVGTLETTAVSEGMVSSIEGLLSDVYAVDGTYVTPTVESGHESDAYISYINEEGITTELASSVSSTDNFMYYIVETAPPLNYTLSYDRWYISGDLSFLTDEAEESVTYTNAEGNETTLTWTVDSTSEIQILSSVEVDNPESNYLSIAKEWDDGDDTSADPSAPEDRPEYVVYRMTGTMSVGTAISAFDYILVLSETELYIYEYSDALWNPASLTAFESARSSAKAVAYYNAYSTTCELDGNDLWHANLDEDYISAASSYKALLKSKVTVTNFTENRTILHMQNPTYNPESTGNNHTENAYVYMSVNTAEFDIHVEKYWADQNNVDQIRATSVFVTLSYNGEKISTVELSDDNDWEHTWSGLTGDIDDYTVEETGGMFYNHEWEYLTGDKTTGYVASYSSIVWDEDDGCYYVLVTNMHGDTPKLTASKKILLEDLEKWLKSDSRDFTIAFTLSGYLEVEDGEDPVSYTETKYVSFQYADLAKYQAAAVTDKNGDAWVTLSVVFGDYDTDETDILNYGDYTLTEQVYKGVVTTEAEAEAAGADIHWELTGITATHGTVLYDDDKNPTGEVTFDVSSDNSSSYNYSATYTNELHANPKISVTKKVLAEEMDWVDEDATFTFTLTSAAADNEDGKEISVTKTVTFTKDEVDTMIADAKAAAETAGTTWDRYITLTVVFGDTELNPEDEELPFGTYTLTEANQILWVLKDITWDSPLNATKDLDARSVTFTVTADSDVDYYYTYFTNTPYLGSIHVIKYDTDGETPLEGVTFELEDAAGNVLYNVDGDILQATTDEHGEVLFERLKAGTYYLTETATASGHTLLTERVAVTIPTAKTDEEIAELEAAGYTVNLDGENTNTIDDTTYFWDLSFTVTNSIQLEMPNSGILDTSNGVPTLPIAICIASACAIGAWVLIRRRRTARLLRA